MVQCYLTYSNQFVEKLLKYQAMRLTTPDNITKLFTLNERLHSSHQEGKQLFWKEVIRAI
nr:hypothetical protein [Candidatus Enterovibrio luxaltus]